MQICRCANVQIENAWPDGQGSVTLTRLAGGGKQAELPKQSNMAMWQKPIYWQRLFFFVNNADLQKLIFIINQLYLIIYINMCKQKIVVYVGSDRRKRP